MSRIPRNSVDFGKILESRCLTYGDLYYYLNGHGIVEYNDVLTKSGCIEKSGDGKYLGRMEYHSCDNGARTPEEKNLDCEVGNIQETLFCIDNCDFMGNVNATRNGSMNVTTKELDLIHIPTGVQVEFKVSYSKMYGHQAYYNHRDSGLRKFLEEGNIMIIYFINLNMAAVISKRNLDKSVKFKNEHIWDKDTGKYWDNVSVWDGLMFGYRMMEGGNAMISRKVSEIVGNR